jgi:hypothetical protein
VLVRLGDERSFGGRTAGTVSGPYLVAFVRVGPTFVSGKLVQRRDDRDQPGPPNGSSSTGRPALWGLWAAHQSGGDDDASSALGCGERSARPVSIASGHPRLLSRALGEAHRI